MKTLSSHKEKSPVGRNRQDATISNSHTASSNTAALTALLDRDVDRLSFPAPYEGDFRVFHARRYLHLNRVCAVIAAVFLMAFIPADLKIIPEQFTLTLILRVIGALTSLLLVGLSFYHAAKAMRLGVWFCLAGVFYHAIIASITLLASHTGQIYVMGTLASPIYFALMMRFPFRQVVWVVGAMAAIQSLLLWKLSISNDLTIELGMMFTVLSVMALIVAYRSEFESRKMWVQRKILDAERTALMETKQALESLSQQDPLTGLANRRLFDQAVEREWRRAQRSQQALGLIMLDVDHFKRFNDHYGHIEGDRCLIAVADVLRRCCQRSGECVTRYGGEEFAVLLPETSAAATYERAQAIVETVRALDYKHAGHPAGRVTVSAGAVSIKPRPQCQRQPTTLVKLADQALYRAKGEGRDRAVLDRDPLPGGNA